MSLRNILIFLFLLGLGLLGFRILFAPPQPSEPLADYGDAPDGDLNMDTGYYAPFPNPALPGVLIWGNAGIDAEFPTVGTDPVPGPYLLDVDDFYIGPFLRGPVFTFPPAFNAGDIPSLESGATDPADPDGPSNLNPPSPITTVADCDKENASHNPALTNCRPVPPFAINMNGILVIWITNRANAIFITRVWTAPNAQTEGIAYWNMLFDLVRDGEWRSAPGMVDEWVVRDQVFPLRPGNFTTLVTQPFPWPTSGAFGRLIFPVWARNMVSSESIVDTLAMTNWDGRGPQGGFAQGEVEDYFIEWRPIGQIFPAPGGGPGGGGGNGGGGGGDVEEADMEKLRPVSCPETMTAGTGIVCETDLKANDKVMVLCLPNGLKGGIAGDETLLRVNIQAPVCGSNDFQASVSLTDKIITINVRAAPPDAALALVILPDKESLHGTGQVPVTSGAFILIGEN